MKMMDRLKKKRWLFVFAAMLVCLAGCGRSDESVAVVGTENESMLWLYYPTADGIAAYEERYQVRQPDSLPAAVEETMSALTSNYGDGAMQYRTYMLDAENNLTLDFSAEELPDETGRLLMDAAVCQTLFQLSDINNISIRVLLEDETELSTKDYYRNSFYFYGYEDSRLNNKVVTIYYPSKSGSGLASGPVNIHQTPNESIPEQIVSVLASRGVLPENTTVNNVSFSMGICYLDISRDFAEGAAGSDGKLLVYSLVNSITEQEGVNAVQILVDGEVVSSCRGFDGMDVPLAFDSSIVQ